MWNTEFKESVNPPLMHAIQIPLERDCKFDGAATDVLLPPKFLNTQIVN